MFSTLKQLFLKIPKLPQVRVFPLRGSNTLKPEREIHPIRLRPRPDYLGLGPTRLVLKLGLPDNGSTQSRQRRELSSLHSQNKNTPDVAFIKKTTTTTTWRGPATSSAHTVSEIGYHLRSQGKLNEAEAFFRRSLEGCERTLGPAHMGTLTSVCNLGTLLQTQGKSTSPSRSCVALSRELRRL